MLHVSVSAYKQAGAERRSDLICRKVGVGGTFIFPPERSVTMVQCTIPTRVDGDVMKVFWSYCSEVIVLKLALLKSPVIIKAASGCAVSCSLIFPYSSLSAWSVLA